MIAYCYSKRCAKNQYTTKPTVKDVPKTCVDCPDCQSTLVWVKSNNYLGARRKTSEKLEESRRVYLG